MTNHLTAYDKFEALLYKHGQSNLSRMLGMNSPQCINGWRKRINVPDWRVKDVERVYKTSFMEPVRNENLHKVQVA